MRIFFPRLLLLVALIVFVISGAFLFRTLPYLSSYLLEGVGSMTTGSRLVFHVVPVMLSMLSSAWVATWARQEITREKTGSLER